MGEIHELFVLALSLVWFAGATPDLQTLIPGNLFRIRYHFGPDRNVVWTCKRCFLGGGQTCNN